MGIKGSRLTADLTDRLRHAAIAHMPIKKIAAEFGSGTAVAVNVSTPKCRGAGWLLVVRRLR